MDDCDCGEPATTTWDEGSEYAFWTQRPRYTPVCAECWAKRDNYDSPDPDGEAFRGGEAAAYLAERCHQARRVK